MLPFSMECIAWTRGTPYCLNVIKYPIDGYNVGSPVPNFYCKALGFARSKKSNHP